MNSTSPSGESAEMMPLVRGFPYCILSLRRCLLAFLVPTIIKGDVGPAEDDPRWKLVQEQVLTGLSRAGAVLGTLALLAAALLLHNVPAYVFAIDGSIISMIWVLGIFRRLAYRLRASLLLLGMYSISCNELLHYGFSQDASILFVLVPLLALLFFNFKVSLIALPVSLITLAAVGISISQGLFTPLAQPRATLHTSVAIMTCLIFVAVVGSVQAGVAVLFAHLRESWQSEYQVRNQLQNERDRLEQRVIERTEALVKAHAQAVAASRYEAEQKEYLEILYQTSLDLFNRRDLDDLLQAIVERATSILDAPFGELMLHEDDELVVRAFTRNQPFLLGDRVRRDQAWLSWQAYDIKQPVLLNDYATWEHRRTAYAEVDLHATADFPILAGQQCLGILAMGRTELGRVFSAADIEKGLSLSRLIALALDNSNLYTTALHEIAERKQAELVLQQYAEELRFQNSELDAFAHTVAHDLKNPLTSLMGYNQLVQLSYTTLPSAQVAPLLNTINVIGRKMNTIIDALLLLASVRTRDVVTGNLIAMDEIVAEAEMRLQDRIAASGAIIIKPATWPMVLGYAPWVEEVWANYISNAIKYGGAPPHITLGATQLETGLVQFWVRDNGVGLRPEQQARLFTLFTRLEPERVEGHGIGLSIVQRIATRLGGEVGVQSALGQGSTFFFTLPVATNL